jgi:hypothetical protein
MGCSLKRRFGDAGLAEALDLLGAAQFFDAKIGRIDRVRVDQNRRNACAAEHGGCGRAGKSASDDCNVGVPHAQGPGSIAPSLRRKCQIIL